MSYDRLLAKLMDPSKKLTEEEVKQFAQLLQKHTAGIDVKDMSSEDIVKFFGEIEGFLDQNEGDLKDIVNIEEKRLEILQDQQGALRRKIDLIIKSKEFNEEELKRVQEEYRLTVQRVKEQKTYFKGLEKGANMADELLKATLGLNREWSSLGSGGGASGFMKGFAKSIYDATTLTNIFMAVVSKMWERLTLYDELQADAFKTVGIKKHVMQLNKMTAKYGSKISAKYKQEYQASIKTLKTNLRSFGEMEDSQVRQVGHSMTVLHNLGVAQVDATKNFGILTKTLGKTVPEATAIQQTMASAAQAIGRPPAEMSRDFHKAMPILARFGSDGIRMFKNTSAEAAKLNMEVSDIISLGERMDTIGGAAKAAQSFNTAVGSPFLSAHALLAANPDEKLALIAKAYQDAGRPTISPRRQRALAKEVGVSVDKIQRILNAEGGQVLDAKNTVNEASGTIDTNTQLITQHKSVMETIMMQMNAVVDKLLAALFGDSGMQGVLSLVGFLAENLKSILMGLVGFAALKAAIAAFTATKGTAMNPMFVYDIAGGLGGGRLGRFGRIAGGAAAIGGGLLMAGAVSDMTGLSEYVGGGTIAGAILGGDSVTNLGDKTSVSLNPTGAAFKGSKASSASMGPGNVSLSGTRSGASGRPGAPGPAGAGGVGGATSADAARAAGAAGMGPVGAARPGALGSGRVGPVGGGGKAAIASPPVVHVDDGFGNINSNMSIPNPLGPPREVNMSVSPSNMSSEYVQPVFNKQDKFYAAKEGGVLANALDEIILLLQHDLDKNEVWELNIEGRELYSAWEHGAANTKRLSCR